MIFMKTYTLVLALGVAASGLCASRLAVDDVALVNSLTVVLDELLL